MKLHNLRPAKGATHKEKRLGRGEAPVKVEHLQKVIKADKAVRVIKVKWHMKVARCQFSAVFQNVDLKIINRVEYKVFNLGQIDQLIEKYDIKEFTLENLYINNLISQNDRVKILGNGELKANIPFKVNAVSEKAKGAIEAAGGTVEIVK